MASSSQIGLIVNNRNRYRIWDTKTTFHARDVKIFLRLFKSREVITFSHLNSNNFKDNFKSNFGKKWIKCPEWLKL